MAQTIDAYIEGQLEIDRETCRALRALIDAGLPRAESKIWQRHPVWFLDGNPIVVFSKLKDGVRVLFWSGQSFETPGLVPEGTFKAAEVRYRHPAEIDAAKLATWLKEAESIQRDYKNIVKRRGKLGRLV